MAGLLPCLATGSGAEFGDRASGWALRSLDVISATQIQDWLEPGRNGLARGFQYQPPLSAWVRALSVPTLGTENLSSWRYVTVALVCCLVWTTYLLSRRLGGTAFGLMATLAVCSHAVMLRLVTGTNPATLGVLLILIAIWGFLGHLEGPAQFVSMRLLAGSLAWGLAVLTIGPAAIVLIIPMFLHVWLLRDGRHDSVPWSLRSSVWQVWLGTRTLAVFVVTALSFSGWWQLMMLANHGSQFWSDWWTGHIALNFPPETPRSFWQDWLAQNVFLCGWLAVGLASAIGELRNRSTELIRRRCQFVLIWWITAVVTRMIFDVPALRRSALIDAWDTLLLLPTAFLAAWGARAVILRTVPAAVESLLCASTVGLVCWRFSGSVWTGVVTFLLGLIVIALVPLIAPRVRRGARRWTERDWRIVLRTAFILILLGHVTNGFLGLVDPAPDSKSLTEVRRRIAHVKDVPQVTLMSLNGELPESLLFVVRSRWPKSQFVAAATAQGILPREAPAFEEELIIEWTQSELRLANELPSNRQATPLGDPLRFRGRRLMLYRVSPRPM